MLSYEKNAGVAEQVDALDLGSGIFRCADSSPATRTKIIVERNWRKSLTSFLFIRGWFRCQTVGEKAGFICRILIKKM